MKLGENDYRLAPQKGIEIETINILVLHDADRFLINILYETCGKLFSQSSNLKRHIHTNH